MPDSRYIAKVRRRKTFWNNVTRVVIQLFVWTGAAVLYYFAFSIFFDTPVEYRLKHSTDRLRREYATLTGRYDSLNRVMENVIARDRNVFHILFEADPYDFEEENAANRWNFYEGLLSQSTIELQKQFARRLDATERAVADLADALVRGKLGAEYRGAEGRRVALQEVDVDLHERFAFLDLLAVFYEDFKAFSVQIYSVDADVEKQGYSAVRLEADGMLCVEHEDYLAVFRCADDGIFGGYGRRPSFCLRSLHPARSPER